MVEINRAITAAGAALMLTGAALSLGQPANAAQPGLFTALTGATTVNAIGIQAGKAIPECANGSSYTIVARLFKDDNGDKINDDAEPQGQPNGLIPLVAGNPVAPWWGRQTDPYFDSTVQKPPSTLTFGTNMTDGSGVMTELQRLQKPAAPMGKHLYVIGGVCVTDTGDPDYSSKEVKLDSQGHPIGTWFVAELDIKDRIATNANLFTWVNGYTPWAGGAVPPSITPAPSSSASVTPAPTNVPSPPSGDVTPSHPTTAASTPDSSPSKSPSTSTQPSKTPNPADPTPTPSGTPSPTPGPDDRPALPTGSPDATDTPSGPGPAAPDEAPGTPGGGAMPGAPGGTNGGDAGLQSSGPLANTGGQTGAPVLMAVGALLLGYRMLRRR